jgi:hypothetical protein
MPSRSLFRWRGARARELDQLAAAHASVGGSGPGRRHATQQINHAYLVLLASQFQGYCRDLHSECVDLLVASLPAGDPRTDMFQIGLLQGRQLDARNAQPASIGSDFGRFRMDFWAVVNDRSPRNAERQAALESLNTWRNAIVHQDFDPRRHGGRVSARLQDVRQFRAACDALAAEFDAVMADRLTAILGRPAW